MEGGDGGGRYGDAGAVDGGDGGEDGEGGDGQPPEDVRRGEDGGRERLDGSERGAGVVGEMEIRQPGSAHSPDPAGPGLEDASRVLQVVRDT